MLNLKNDGRIYARRGLTIRRLASQGGQTPDREQRRTVEHLGKSIVGLGVVLVIVGLILWFAADKAAWFGHLPGDIRIERPGFRLYIPITTMILLSIGLSVLLWLLGKFFR